MRTKNPALNLKAFDQVRSYGAGESMTIQGTVNKTFVMLFLLVMSASWVWSKLMRPAALVGGFEAVADKPVVNVGPYLMLGLIGGMIAALVTIFKKEWAPVSAPIYAVLEGLFIGGISAIFEMQYPGIVIQAVSLTFATMFSLLVAYKFQIIRVTQKFRMGIIAATGAICLVYFINFIMSFFGGSISVIHSNGTFGIVFSLIVVAIAALNLVLDFDFIENASSMGLPKYMEWYGAFGLMVTLVWLYIEILRLLSKLRSRD